MEAISGGSDKTGRIFFEASRSEWICTTWLFKSGGLQKVITHAAGVVALPQNVDVDSQNMDDFSMLLCQFAYGDLEHVRCTKCAAVSVCHH